MYYNESNKTLEEFWNQHSEWSQKTFGTDSERGPLGSLKHLLKEVQEAIDDPGDTIEIIDCLSLVFDAARRAGLTYQDVIDLAFHKLEINKKRKWPEPTTEDPVEHTRE